MGGLVLPGSWATPSIKRLEGPGLALIPDLNPEQVIPMVRRVMAAVEPEDRGDLETAFVLARKSPAGVETIQRVLDRLCLVGVDINPEMRVKAAPGPAAPELGRGVWRACLVKVHNQAGTTAELRATNSEAGWLDLRLEVAEPLSRTLSGQRLEYRILRLYSRDEGWREASLGFDVGQGSQDLGFRNEVPILFDCMP